MLTSRLCTQAQLEAGPLTDWVDSFPGGRGPGGKPSMHRKLWEWCFIAQALHERGLLRPGSRGLGFAVGREALPALFAARGCEIVATDNADAGDWAATGQHAGGLAALEHPGVCPPEEFARRVRFRAVDMNAVPDDLTGFDFCWSSCALEHLGSLEHGLRFLRRALRCLRPGGVAVHTTEYNVSSDADTLSDGWCVLYRRHDVTKLAEELHRVGHHVALDLDPGDGPLDRAVSEPPYAAGPHLKLRLGGYVATSLGLIVTTPRRPALGRVIGQVRHLRRRVRSRVGV